MAPTEFVAKLVSSTSRLVPESFSQVVSLRSVVSEESLVVIMRGGDISSMKLGDPDLQASQDASYTRISHIDELISSSLSSRLLAPLKMGYKRPHGLQMIRCSSLLRVSLLYHCIQLGCLILYRGGEVDCHDVIFRCSPRVRLTYR